MTVQLTLPLPHVDAVDGEPILHPNRDDQSTIEKALAILSERHSRGETLSSPDITKQFLRLKLGESYHEVFGCIFLDNRHRIISIEDLFFGTIDGASVHPRVIVQKALFCNAAAAVLYHNHPSGVAEPSPADRAITRRIQDALALVDVRVLDHLVVTAGACESFAERGLL